MEEEYKYKILYIYVIIQNLINIILMVLLLIKIIKYKVFKIKKAINVQNKKELILENKYFIITDIHILFFIVGDYDFKNECKLEFYGEIMHITIVNEF